MRILKLTANNFLNLRAIELSPNGESLILSGKNGAGKTSILRAIEAALGGSRKSPQDPIRHGQERAEIVVQTDKWIARRIYTAKGERLEVTTPEGATFKSPQSLLDAVLGDVSFDPLAFKTMDPAKQRAIILQLAQLDFSGLDAERKAAYDERAAQSKHTKTLLARLEALPEIQASLPKKPLSSADLLAALEFYNKEASDYEAACKRKLSLDQTLSHLEADIDGLEAQLIEKRDQRDGVKQSLAAIEIPPNDFAEKREVVRAQLADLDQTNAAIHEREKRVELETTMAEAKQKAEEAEETIRSLDAEKTKRLAEATYPLEGISLSEDGVLFNGVLLDQLSDGEAIRVSVAVAMALNPTLRVILIRNGSLLDEEGKRALLAMAEAQDYQVWMEEVDSSGRVGIYIEDGKIVSTEGPALSALENVSAPAQAEESYYG